MTATISCWDSASTSDQNRAFDAKNRPPHRWQERWGGFLLLAVGLVISPAIPRAAEVSWQHQYYEPIEDADCIREAEEAFAEAIRLYGEPASPVKEIHLRRSVRKEKIFRLSRADILDWTGLAERLSSQNLSGDCERIWSALLPPAQAALRRAGQEALTLEDRLAILESLNAYIAAEDRADAAAADAKRPRGFFSRWRRVDQERNNRERLCGLFPGIIAPLVPSPGRQAERFQLCECADAERGVYVIYVSVSPEDDEFHLQLAHEAHHLLDSALYDWYAEGLGNVFAEHWARQRGVSWEPWRALFAKGAGRDPYAIAYFMMREVAEIA
ncbi:MAG: hypothetical protein N3A66_06985, partial [Planctomycetota bacterium]|nr:hypothetical protein [Planctomycetota bacterium]